MTVYCSRCGTGHPDNASFCMQCGNPISPAAQAAAQPQAQWEFCEVEWDPSGSFFRKYILMAKAVGPKGVYIAAKASRGINGIPSATDRDGQAALKEVLGILAQQGWEPVGKGTDWYRYKFRRQIH